jgi:hypothetical protein
MSKSKAEQLADDLLAHPREPGEHLAARRRLVPELRLRADTPTVDLSESTSAANIALHLHGADAGPLALRERTADVTAVVVPLARYLELVEVQLAYDPATQPVADLAGHIGPSEAAFAASRVERVDPTA